ncbi:hypothetical protein EJ08DRAFT_665735 [Tothia fuscella]|uniref:Uncharacterized protein n=1 Tax=Tothia fuscella TaxID=1048955 RepID=A0A9P4NFX1_9PEZI|nr:hypothetical protein EJ08DRAFT_665735 [Tothia fuscella]
MDTGTIISIILAVISLLGTLVIAGIGYFTSQKLEEHSQGLADKYKALQEQRTDARQLVSIPSAKLTWRRKGLDDIKLFTCFKFAQFLAWTHILKIKTQYFSFTADTNLSKIGELILRFNEEFDRRRNYDGQNLGVWPGNRYLVAERMLKDASGEKEIPIDTMVKGYNEFHRDWESQFQAPMSYFCQWVDDMMLGRRDHEEHWDDAMRCTQHNLFDMVVYLDKRCIYRDHMRRSEKPVYCDCTVCKKSLTVKPLQFRGDSRNNDEGVRPWYAHERVDRAYEASMSLEVLFAKTYLKDYDQAKYRNKS